MGTKSDICKKKCWGTIIHSSLVIYDTNQREENKGSLNSSDSFYHFMPSNTTTLAEQRGISGGLICIISMAIYLLPDDNINVMICSFAYNVLLLYQ